MVGTVRSNKSWIMQEFIEKRNVGSCLYGYRNDSTLLSFQAKVQKVVSIQILTVSTDTSHYRSNYYACSSKLIYTEFETGRYRESQFLLQ